MFRSLLAIGAGLAAGYIVFQLLSDEGAPAEADDRPSKKELEVDADNMPLPQKEALLSELEAQL